MTYPDLYRETWFFLEYDHTFTDKSIQDFAVHNWTLQAILSKEILGFEPTPTPWVGSWTCDFLYISGHFILIPGKRCFFGNWDQGRWR